MYLVLNIKMVINEITSHYITYGSFPLSGTGQYSTVRYDSGRHTLNQLSFPLPTVPLLDRCGVCRKVAIDNKARQ